MRSPAITRPLSLTGFHLGLVGILLLVVPAYAADTKLSEPQRQEIIRAFLAEHPFVHRAFPRGKEGIHIEGDKITPSEAETAQQAMQYGPAAKPGDRAQITAVRFVHHAIIFEINGGPVKRKNWRDRVSVGVGGVDPTQTTSAPPTPTDDDVMTKSNGSFVYLAIKDDASSLTVAQIKDMLAPVLDFKAMSVAEAYQKSLPPLLAAAVKDHHALVGMDKEMVTYTLGRPPRRIRENKEGQDYEEWIYGAPPQDVQFIRFISDKCVSIEDMKVTGEKVVRTRDEVGDLNGALNASAPQKPRPAAAASPADEEQRSAPSLLRPGEKPSQETRDAAPSRMPVPDTSSPAPNSPDQ